MEKIIIHIHIPKTGGMSMVEMWNKKYKTLCVYEVESKYSICDAEQRIYLWMDLVNRRLFSLEEAIAFAKLRRYEVIVGNLVIPIVDETLRKHFKEVEYITFVREPYERSYSEYCHNVQNGLKYDSEESFYKSTANTISRQLGTDLSKLSFIGDFRKFSDEVKSLGLEEVHNNKSVGKEQPRNQELIEQYNQIDHDLYASIEQVWYNKHV